MVDSQSRRRSVLDEPKYFYRLFSPSKDDLSEHVKMNRVSEITAPVRREGPVEKSPQVNPRPITSLVKEK